LEPLFFAKVLIYLSRIYYRRDRIILTRFYAFFAARTSLGVFYESVMMPKYEYHPQHLVLAGFYAIAASFALVTVDINMSSPIPMMSCFCGFHLNYLIGFQPRNVWPTEISINNAINITASTISRRKWNPVFAKANMCRTSTLRFKMICQIPKITNTTASALWAAIQLCFDRVITAVSFAWSNIPVTGSPKAAMAINVATNARLSIDLLALSRIEFILDNIFDSFPQAR
jgi:hypothetical protein